MALATFTMALGTTATASPETDALEDRLASGDIDGDDLAVLPDRTARAIATSGRGHASISLVGFTRPWTTGTRETGGLVVVGIPLERLAFAHVDSSRAGSSRAATPPTPTPFATDTAPAPTPQAADDASTDEDAHDESPLIAEDVPQPSAWTPPNERTPQRALFVPTRFDDATPPRLRKVRETTATGAIIVDASANTDVARLADPPLTPHDVRACVAAALRASGLGADERGIDAIVSRARWSATLPEVRLRAVQYDDQRLYTDVTTASDTSRLRDSVGAQVSLEARLTWRLDHLLFADDEPTFERIKNDRREARARVQKRVLDALFRWQRAVVEERLGDRDGDRTTAEAAESLLHRAEAEATLDVLTGGWFSAWQSRRRPAPTREEAETPTSATDRPRAALDSARFLGHWSPMLAESRDKLEDLQRRLMTLRGHL